MSKYILEFEQPIKEIEMQINSLKDNSGKTGIDISNQLKELQLLLDEIFEEETGETNVFIQQNYRD